MRLEIISINVLNRDLAPMTLAPLTLTYVVKVTVLSDIQKILAVACHLLKSY